MTSKPRSEVRQRQHMVNVRLTDQEWSDLLTEATKRGVSLPSLLRRAALDDLAHWNLLRLHA